MEVFYLELLIFDVFYNTLMFSADLATHIIKAKLENRIRYILSSENKLNSDKSSGLLPPTQQPNPSILNDTTTLKTLQNIVQSNLLGPLGSRI